MFSRCPQKFLKNQICWNVISDIPEFLLMVKHEFPSLWVNSHYLPCHSNNLFDFSLNSEKDKAKRFDLIFALKDTWLNSLVHIIFVTNLVSQFSF